MVGLSKLEGMILASLAIAVAVSVLSPVTILTVMPATLQFWTACGTAYLSGSLIPATPITIRSFSRVSGCYEKLYSLLIYLQHSRRVLNDSLEKLVDTFLNCYFHPESIRVGVLFLLK